MRLIIHILVTIMSGFMRKELEHKIGKTKIGRKFSANLYLANYFRDKRYDFVYNRYGLSDPFFKPFEALT